MKSEAKSRKVLFLGGHFGCKAEYEPRGGMGHLDRFRGSSSSQGNCPARSSRQKAGGLPGWWSSIRKCQHAAGWTSKIECLENNGKPEIG